MAGGRPELIRPEWPAPGRVRAVSTTRVGGASAPPYDGLNLGMHVGDRPADVAANRVALLGAACLPGAPGWLEQVHGTAVADFDAADPAGNRVPPTADAAVTSRPGRVCVIMTADCVPILIADSAGTVVAAAHGGWRGLVAGVVEATVAAVCARGVDPGSLLAWLGPAIGAAAYEVGAQVTEALGGDDTLALMPGPSGRTHLDLDCLARGRLRGCGVERIYGGGACTHADSTRFFSHRRDGMTGRQASLIWLERAPGHADRLKGGKMAPLSR